jgi:hypothetical protein
VAGGGRMSSEAGGEFFQRGLEWRRELCKIISRFYRQGRARIISFFNMESTRSRAIILPLSPFLEIYFHLIQSEHYFQPYFQLKKQICPIFMDKLSNNLMVIYFQKKWTFLVESKRIDTKNNASL